MLLFWLLACDATHTMSLGCLGQCQGDSAKRGSQAALEMPIQYFLSCALITVIIMRKKNNCVVLAFPKRKPPKNQVKKNPTTQTPQIHALTTCVSTLYS